MKRGIIILLLVIALAVLAWRFVYYLPIGISGLRLRWDAALAFRRMYRAATAAGIRIIPSGPRSALRTTADQAALVAERPEFAAPVGKSKHQQGLALDIAVAEHPKTAEWLAANARAYGFRRTVEREPWHWEYIA